MALLRVRQSGGFAGEVHVPGDKSISHRALLLGALAEGETRIRNWLPAGDCQSTRRCLKALGVHIVGDGEGGLGVPAARAELARGAEAVSATGAGGELSVWTDAPAEPQDVLDCGNSGTTMRLLLGVLASRPWHAVLTGDGSLRARPMARVVEPLRLMGAQIDGRAAGRLAPLALRGGALRGIEWRTEVASAQVKSALLLAGLEAAGTTIVEEPALSRDHTERMLASFGVRLRREGSTVEIAGGQRLRGRLVEVPGDLSAAAFFLVAAAIVPGARVVVRSVGVNPTRTGFLDVLRAMGARVEVSALREVSGEPVADVTLTASPLRGVRVGGELIPRLVDEVPVLTVAAAVADGVTEIRDAAELRHKESDRLQTMASGLRRLGVAVEELPDGLRVRGGRRLLGASVDACGDHRVAMSLAVAGLVADGETIVEGSEAVDISFPGFAAELARWW